MAYIPHDYWMICQRTGLKFRRSEMRQEWTGEWVHKSVWNPRHPQEFVKVLPEDTSVWPVSPDIAITTGETTVYFATIVSWTKNAFLVSVSGLSDKDPIGIKMNNGATHWTFIDDTPTEYSNAILIDSNGEPVYDSDGELILTADSASWGLVVLNDPIPHPANSGNAIFLPSINNEDWQ